jgi:hypothetical protein
MHKMKCLAFGITLLVALAVPAGVSATVTLCRTPDQGLQPQAAVDASGVVHLIYYQGDPSAGNLFYVHRAPGQADFSKPLLVNSQPGSATAMGTIRGAQLALGNHGRIHIAWNGMGKGASQVPINGKPAAPLLYTRLNDAGTAFELERNLINYAAGLDGGSSVAADPKGNVYVTWQAPLPGNAKGEAGRAVFVAASLDEGKTFARERPALSEPTGACPCCGMRAFADNSGTVWLLFRAATDGVNRDELLLVSRKPGADFEMADRHPWKANICPMSSAALSPGQSGVLAAWETAGQVYFATVNPNTLQVSEPICPPAGAARKHPVAVGNARGETLLVWTEGTQWAKGGSVAWQVYARDGALTAEQGRVEGLPAWSLATAFPQPDGNFVIVY